MSRALDQLLAILDIETLEVNLFRGVSPQVGWQRVFGGQVIGQALVAAYRTVEGRARPFPARLFPARRAIPSVPIIYEVDRIRDGGSFSTRRVVAIQHGQAIFSMAASFHKQEEGLSHQMKMPEVPPPESLPSEAELKELLHRPSAAAGQGLLGARAADRDQAGRLDPLSLARRTAPPPQQVWIRATGTLGDDLALHQCVLAYASDFTLLDTALIAHGRFVFDPSADAGKPRPRDLVSSEIQGRRVAALRPGQPNFGRRPRLLPRHSVHPRRASLWPRRPKKGWSGSATAEYLAINLGK